MKKIFLITLLILTMFSCKKKQFIDEDLIRTGWILTEIRENNDDLIYEKTDSTKRDTYLVFTSDMNIVGYTSISPIYDTKYEIDENKSMKFNILIPRVYTKDDMLIYFSTYSSYIYRYNFVSDRLYIYFKDDKKFIFKRG